MRDLAIRDTVETLEGAEAFNFLDDQVLKSIEVSQEIRRILSVTLAIMKQRWDEFPLEELSWCEYDFYNYAKQRTGGYSRSAIDNHVNVGGTWLLGNLPKDIPERVELYDSKGKPTGEIIDVDPRSQSTSKLLVATGAAKDGRLAQDPVALGQLFNPEVSVHILSDTIQGRTKKLEPTNGFRMFNDSGIIYASQGEKEVWVAELSMEGDELVLKAIDYITTACNIRS